MTPAAFREVRKYLRADVQSEVIARAASQLRMKLADSSQGLMTFSVRLSFWSWGERVTAVLGSVDGCCVVDITSSCILKTQAADWGKNERNVRRLFDEIDTVLGDEREHEQCLLCGGCGYLLVGIPVGTCPECGHKYSAADRPGKQEVATIGNAIAIAVVFTAVEFVFILLLDMSGVGKFVPGPVHGLRGAAFLLRMNLVASLAVIGLHRLVKRYTRRR